jgi:exopolysaccharide biosynthesis polyprenyl glycosylphosphotransferase
MRELKEPSTERPAAPTVPGLRPWLRHAVRTVLHIVLDGAAVALAYGVAYLIRFHWDFWTSQFPVIGVTPDWALYERILYAVVPLWLAIFFYSSRLYSGWLGSADRFLQIVKGAALGAGATMISTYIYQRLQYSRMMLLLVFPVAVLFVCVSQAIVLWLDEWLAQYEEARPVLLIGEGQVAEEITSRIHARHPGADVRRLPRLPSAADLAKRLEDGQVIEVLLLRSNLPHKEVLEAAEVCDGMGVAFRMIPDLLELRLGEIQMDHTLGIPSYLIRHTSLTALNFIAKRTFDLAFSGLVVLVCGIPFLILCALIKFDSKGPVLYKQKRYGMRSRIFEAFKFRTMVADAEAKIQTVLDKNDQAGAFFKAKRDPRVTRVGSFLRRFSLDEFPQFINVLRGEMSVVGPRPLAVTTGELERLEKDFGATAKKRMNVLPGITGLWQVSGRSDVSSEQRFALDLFYIEHWSLGMDLEIILKTVPAMVFGKGAY